MLYYTSLGWSGLRMTHHQHSALFPRPVILHQITLTGIHLLSQLLQHNDLLIQGSYEVAKYLANLVTLPFYNASVGFTGASVIPRVREHHLNMNASTYLPRDHLYCGFAAGSYPTHDSYLWLSLCLK